MTVELICGPGAYQKAVLKARYGHRRWIFWRDQDGAKAARLTEKSLKSAMMANGTKGKWTLIESDGTSMAGFWWLGCNILCQIKRGV